VTDGRRTVKTVGSEYAERLGPGGFEAGYAASIGKLVSPSAGSPIDILANANVTGNQQQALEGLLERGFSQARDPRTPYDLDKLLERDMSKADFKNMPYPLQMAMSFMITSLAIDAFNARRVLQMHVGFLVNDQTGDSRFPVVGPPNRNGRRRERDEE